MSLFSVDDFRALNEAMRRNDEITIIRTLRDITIKASTFRVKPPWDVDMIIQVRLDQGNITYIENFKTVEEAEEGVNSWESQLY